MKNVFILIFLAFCIVANGQIIDFPDANFKNALVNTFCADMDGDGSFDSDADLNDDGEIDVSEAMNIKGLNIDNQNIKSLEGLHHFKSLTGLHCRSNKISTLKIENLNSLLHLYSTKNDSLKNVILTTLPNLSTIDLSQSGLDSLNIKDLPSVTNLKCSDNIFLKSFTITNLPKLRVLECDYTGLNSLEIKGLPILWSLNCSQNKSLTDLKLTNLPYLSDLDCSSSGFVSLEFKNLPALKKLTCKDNSSLSDLKLTNLPKLTTLDCSSSGFITLDIKNLSSLSKINCAGNAFLRNLLLNNLSSLTELDCSFSGLNILDMKNLPSLNRLYCYNNKSLTSLILVNLPKLQVLDCQSSGIISLDLNDLPSLFLLSCGYSNALNQITLKNLPNLSAFLCENSGIISLDINDLPSLNGITCNSNKYLKTITLNNLPALTSLDCGFSDLISINLITELKLSNFEFNINPNLKYICCSENNFPLIDSLLNLYGYSNVNVTNYCSFDPFSDFGVVTGKVVLDADNNGCDNNDKNLSTAKFDIVGPSKSGTFVFAGSDKYEIPMVIGTNTITPILEHPNHFEVTPSSLTITFPTTSDTITQDFCITPKGIFRQTNITVIPLTPPARPGFDASYKIVWENVGNQIESGTLNFTYEETLLNYISATQTADLKLDGIVSWYFNNLLPFEKREITVTLKVNRPTDTPAANAGDKLYLTASILDNIFTLENTVVGSYDPNDKTCLQGDRVKPDMVGEYVDYLIRFENTGNFAAENVVIKDIIDTKTFDISTLKITDASHEVYTRIDGNKVEFIFENIQLSFDDANNDGYIAFKIKTLPSLVLGDSLKNLADIYFDYNFPIRTNEAQTTVAFPVFTKDITTEVNVYPNPVTDILYLDTNENWTKAEIYDILGRIMRSISLNGQSIDVSRLESGTYFIRLKQGDSVGLVKFVKI